MQCKSMMESISQNIQGFCLNQQPLYSSQQGSIFELKNPVKNKLLVLKVVYQNVKNNNYQQEKNTHQTLKNKFIVQLQNAFKDKACYYLVLQHCSKGNLRSLMNREQKMTLQKVKNIAEQVAKGIQYLHNKVKFVHHDIKPENILITADEQVKICDFGLASKISQNGVKGCLGTLGYAAPEGIQIHNQKFDIWSLGCLIHEMVVGTVPFQFKNWKELTSTLTEQYLNHYQYDPNLPEVLVHLLRKIFTMDKKNRININQVIDHPFFTGKQLPLEKNEDRPLVVKERSKKSLKSLENKYDKHNKQNVQSGNRLPQRRIPNYEKELFDRKMKREQKNRPVTGQKKVQSKTLTQQRGKEQKSSLQTTQNLNSRKSSKQLRRQQLSPLNTRDIRIKPILLNGWEVSIDRFGITKKVFKKEQTKFMSISPNGQNIIVGVNGDKKQYSLENLPIKFHKEYQKCKEIVLDMQSRQWKPKFSISDHNFMGGLQLTIMQNNMISVTIPEKKIKFEKLSPQDIKQNVYKIDEKINERINNIVPKLVEMNELF